MLIVYLKYNTIQIQELKQWLIKIIIKALKFILVEFRISYECTAYKHYIFNTNLTSQLMQLENKYSYFKYIYFC